MCVSSHRLLPHRFQFYRLFFASLPSTICARLACLYDAHLYLCCIRATYVRSDRARQTHIFVSSEIERKRTPTMHEWKSKRSRGMKKKRKKYIYLYTIFWFRLSLSACCASLTHRSLLTHSAVSCVFFMFIFLFHNLSKSVVTASECAMNVWRKRERMYGILTFTVCVRRCACVFALFTHLHVLCFYLDVYVKLMWERNEWEFWIGSTQINCLNGKIDFNFWRIFFFLRFLQIFR